MLQASNNVSDIGQRQIIKENAMTCLEKPLVPPFSSPTLLKRRWWPALLSLAVVILLPAFSFAQNATLTDDARTNGSKSNRNFGADDTVQVRGTTERGLLKFKLTPSLPAGTRGSFVGKATLKLFVRTLGAPGQVVVRRVTGAWDEQSVTDATFPTLGVMETTATLGNGSDGKWVTFDVTQLVRDWLDNVLPNNGVALLSSGGADVDFDSKENQATSHEPRLEIVLNHAATADQADTATAAATANTITGVLPANKGGTGLSAPGAVGNVLRSNGATWASAPLTPADFPGLANSFIQNQNTATPQAANFNISGNGTAAGTLSGNTVNATTQYNLSGNRILSTAGFQNAFVGLNTGASNTAGCCNAFFGFNAGRLNNANDNSFFGNNAGQANTTGSRNSFFGSTAGFANVTGSSNSFFGVSAGQNNTGGSNSFFGDSAGFSNTASGNSFFGASAGRSNTTGVQNAFFGLGAGFSNQAGCCNAFFGFGAGALSNANDNSFFGNSAGAANTTGTRNSFLGSAAGLLNQVGSDNSFFGVNSGRNNTAGNNSFFGSLSGQNNTAGNANAFFGDNSGRDNTTGSRNSLFGSAAGLLNTTGTDNSFFGYTSGEANTGGLNSFFGSSAGRHNTASGNSFFGSFAGEANTGGSANAFFGASAGRNNTTGTGNTFVGLATGSSNVGGNSNTLFGTSADVGADGLTNATAIGARAQVTQSNSLVLGSINGVNGAAADTKVGIGTTAPTSRLTVAGLIETTTGGVKFPDGTIQTTAAAGGSVTTDGTTLTGNGTAASPLAIKGSGVGTAQLADGAVTTDKLAVAAVTAAKIAPGQVVKSLNGLTDNVTLAAGSNVTITPSGNTLTISATGSGSGGGGGGSFIQNQTIQQTGANFNIDGTGKADSFDAQTQYNLGGNRVLISRASPYNNLFVGLGAGGQVTDGGNNSFFGTNAGSNATSTFNSFFGFNAGNSTTFGGNNSFFGANAGTTNASGVANSFFGTFAGQANTTGNNNTFVGYHAGFLNTTGSTNSFFGNAAGNANTTGHENTIVGAFAGSSNTTGFNNSLFGYQAGLSTTGNNNAFVGFNAGANNTTGSNNTAIGFNANFGFSGTFDHATAIGADSSVSANDTIALGRVGGLDTVLVYGKLQVNMLGSAGSTALCLNSTLQISSCSSSLRYKTSVAPFHLGLNVVNQLRPITFRWKADGQPDVGFGAEDVAQVNPLFVNYNTDGQVEGVKYDRLTTVLVNAVKEQQEQLSEQSKRIGIQEKQIEEQRTEIEQQRESLQKQQAQIEALKRLVCSQSPTADVCQEDRK